MLGVNILCFFFPTLFRPTSHKYTSDLWNLIVGKFYGLLSRLIITFKKRRFLHKLIVILFLMEKN